MTGLSHLEQVKRLIDGGAEFIQLREKHLSPRDFMEDADDAVEYARARGVRIIINDRVDVAKCAGADGVHLGQTDLPPDAARRILGQEAVIGYSTHSVEQARLASEMPVDYIAIGPVFATSTKEDPDPVVGLDGLANGRAVIGDIPLVAIGGIAGDHLAAVIHAGADSAAIVSAVLRPPATISENLQRLLTKVQ